MTRPRHAAIRVRLPALLHPIAGTATLDVRAATLAEALQATYARVPALRFHFCEDDGTFRPHVLCFLNDRSTREMPTLDAPLRDGDEITFLQAISGGSDRRHDVDAAAPGVYLPSPHLPR